MHSVGTLHRVSGCVPVGVAAIVPHLCDQRIQLPDFHRLAADAGDLHLRLNAVEIGQVLGWTDHAPVVQAIADRTRD